MRHGLADRPDEKPAQQLPGRPLNTSLSGRLPSPYPECGELPVDDDQIRRDERAENSHQGDQGDERKRETISSPPGLTPSFGP